MVYIKFLVGAILMSSGIYAQNLLYNSGEMAYVNGKLENYILDHNEMKDFPNVIPSLVNDLMKSQTGDFYNKMTFLKGFELHLDEFYNDFPDRLNRFNTIIPHYIFHFVFSDSAIGVDRYEFRLGMDYLGQIIFLDFPHKYNFKSYAMMSLDSAIAVSDSLAQEQDYTYEDFNYYLNYDALRNDLIWHISYSKSDTIDENFIRWNYFNTELSTRQYEVTRVNLDTSDFKIPIIETKTEILPIINSE